MTGPSAAEQVDRIVAAVTAVDGVVGLHSGPGVATTHLPGRTVAGVRMGREGAVVHVVLALHKPLLVTAEQVKAAAGAAAGVPVDVVIGDVVGQVPNLEERQ